MDPLNERYKQRSNDSRRLLRLRVRNMRGHSRRSRTRPCTFVGVLLFWIAEGRVLGGSEVRRPCTHRGRLPWKTWGRAGTSVACLVVLAGEWRRERERSKAACERTLGPLAATVCRAAAPCNCRLRRNADKRREIVTGQRGLLPNAVGTTIDASDVSAGRKAAPSGDSD